MRERRLRRLQQHHGHDREPAPDRHHLHESSARHGREPGHPDARLRHRHPGSCRSWDIGADELNGDDRGEAAVVRGGARATAPVSLEWRTASELDNLGFHVYRALVGGRSVDAAHHVARFPGSARRRSARPTRSATAGLTNGTRYFYRLEDVDASSKTTSHGPVSAVPLGGCGRRASARGCGAGEAQEEGRVGLELPGLGARGLRLGGGPTRRRRRCAARATAIPRRRRSASCRATRARRRSSCGRAASTAPATSRVGHGARVRPRLRLPAGRAGRGAADPPRARRRGRGPPGPARRRARARSRRASGASCPRRSARPRCRWAGTAPCARARRGASARRPRRASRSASSRRSCRAVFQGETKSAVVEIAPLRFDAQRQQLVLAKRVLVRLLFTGREPGESGRGSLGRAPSARKPAVSGEVAGPALHHEPRAPRRRASSSSSRAPARLRRVAAAARAAGRAGGLPPRARAAALRPRQPALLLRRHGPRPRPTSRPRWPTSSSAGTGGVAMPLSPRRPTRTPSPRRRPSRAPSRPNRFYQPGLLDAPDPWLWEAARLRGATRVKSFALAGVTPPPASAELDVYLQGGVGVRPGGRPPRERVAQRHARGRGALRGQAALPHRACACPRRCCARARTTSRSRTSPTPASRRSSSSTASASPTRRRRSLASGRLRGHLGRERDGQRLRASRRSAACVVDVSAAGAPAWLSGYEAIGRQRALPRRGRTPLPRRVPARRCSARASRAPRPPTLRATTNQADYILVAPRAFLDGRRAARRAPAGPGTHDPRRRLRGDRRRRSGTASPPPRRSRTSSPTPSTPGPAPRRATCCCSATRATTRATSWARSQPSPLPALWTKTTLPLDRLRSRCSPPSTATTRCPTSRSDGCRPRPPSRRETLVAEAPRLGGLRPGPRGTAALVADNPDVAGDFEADVEDIAASFLAGRASAACCMLRELGAETRPRDPRRLRPAA